MKPYSFLTVCVLAFCFTAPALGQDETTSAQEKSVKRKASTTQVSDERKEQLLTFVSENHPELNDLLSQLEKGKKRRQYRQAIAGLNKSVTKLESIKERNPQRYEFAIEQWQLESRIKVAAAQVKLKDTEELRNSLKAFVTQLVDLHIKRMKWDREQTQKRLEQLDKRIVDSESSREETIEKRIKSYSRAKKKEKKKD